MTIGIIGGSGIYDLENLDSIDHVAVDTPFGAPSDAFVKGSIDGCTVFFLPRHGRGHRLLPSEINHRANIYALKTLGVSRVLSVSAVGSLREALRPRDIVLPDQYLDRTKQSHKHTFFGDGIVAHVAFGDPTCHVLREHIAAAAGRVIQASPEDHDVRVNSGGTYVSMEGPAFSTRAESHFYRQLGCHVIGMTSLAEAKLCREAELCYQAMAMVTDYDCWRQNEDGVNVAMVIEHLKANTALAKQILQELIPSLPEQGDDCACGDALATALMTDKQAIPAASRERLEPIIGRYL